MCHLLLFAVPDGSNVWFPSEMVRVTTIITAILIVVIVVFFNLHPPYQLFIMFLFPSPPPLCSVIIKQLFPPTVSCLSICSTAVSLLNPIIAVKTSCLPCNHLRPAELLERFDQMCCFSPLPDFYEWKHSLCSQTQLPAEWTTLSKMIRCQCSVYSSLLMFLLFLVNEVLCWSCFTSCAGFLQGVPVK